jgi:aryl-alcohol dehydrogenase-like predicted oxidoreductase
LNYGISHSGKNRFVSIGAVAWRLAFGGVFGDVGFDECKRCLDTALDLGINFIDCSPYYGLTKAETMLGRTLQGVARDKYILATKVGRYGAEEADFDFSAARVTRSVDESCGVWAWISSTLFNATTSNSAT